MKYLSYLVLSASKGSPWADTMVLNPAMIKDPSSDRLHMLFRATGPWPKKQLPGKPLPYPIFLGYAYSDDFGQSWQADFSRPALAPMLAYGKDKIYITNIDGRHVVDYSNGCIEDPRLMMIDGILYLTVACRMFPPGPYWDHDEPTQCAPDWINDADQPFGTAARTNLTVSVLYQVNLDRLKAKKYEEAFTYVTHLTDPEVSDNRDAFLFPEKVKIDGRFQYVMIHRPRESVKFPGGKIGAPPLIYLASAESFEDFPTTKCRHRLLADPKFPWEGNRIGGSFPPIKIGENEWLLGYHGKQDDVVGYTQSFMILRQNRDGWPEVVHRCPERLMYAREPWEFSTTFKIPCVFSCSGIAVGDELIIGYGAGDECVGTAKLSFHDLISLIRHYNGDGNRQV